jgi:hypothetical protein
VVSDGRLLVVTTTATPTVRILVRSPASYTSAGIVGFAVTGENLLGA